MTGFGLQQRRAARRGRRTSPPPSGSPAGPACARVPHGGELCGPASVAACLDDLRADRIGHGVRRGRGPRAAGPAGRRGHHPGGLPGVQRRPRRLRRRRLTSRCARCCDAGVPVALGADDPLLFGSRLTAQYEIARQAHGLTDEQLAELARMSVRRVGARPTPAGRLLAGIDAWLAAAIRPAARPRHGAPEAPASAPSVPPSEGDADQHRLVGKIYPELGPDARADLPRQRQQIRRRAHRRGWSAPACAWSRSGPRRRAG